MSLIPFEIVDPTKYYNGSAKSFDKRFYVDGKQMSLQMQYLPFHWILDSRGEELREREAMPGVLYRNKHGDEKTEFYFIDISEPFRTTIQIVGKIKNRIIAQDTTPDFSSHGDRSPYYLIYTADIADILLNFTAVHGRITGEFKLKVRGSSTSLGLA